MNSVIGIFLAEGVSQKVEMLWASPESDAGESVFCLLDDVVQGLWRRGEKRAERMYLPMNKNTKMVCFAGHDYLNLSMQKYEEWETLCR
jgi:hypothetical protein